MEENIIFKYFDIIFKIVDNRPHIKLKLKELYKSTISPPLRSDNRPYSGVTKEYYIHYLGNDIGEVVYTERKKLCSKISLLQWYILNVDSMHKDLIETEISRIKSNITTAMSRHYNSPAGEITKLKYKERSKKYSKLIGQKNSEKWKDDTWRNIQIERRRASGMYDNVSKLNKERMNDSEFKRRFIESCNSPERIKKISDSAKQMWADARKNDRDKFYRMILSCKNKNYECNGYKMNYIEYQIALLLNEMSVNWKYENVLHLDSKTYIPDFIVNDNIIIECFGDFWHANPRYFKPTDTTHKTRTAYEVWRYDNEKIVNLKNNSYNILILWETDILENIEYCKQQIKEILCNT